MLAANFNSVWVIQVFKLTVMHRKLKREGEEKKRKRKRKKGEYNCMWWHFLTQSGLNSLINFSNNREKLVFPPPSSPTYHYCQGFWLTESRIFEDIFVFAKYQPWVWLHLFGALRAFLQRAFRGEWARENTHHWSSFVATVWTVLWKVEEIQITGFSSHLQRGF